MTTRCGNPEFGKLPADRELSEVEVGMLIAEYSKHGSVERAAKTLHFSPRLAWDVISDAIDKDPSIPGTAQVAKEFGMAYRECAWLMVKETKAQIKAGKVYGKNIVFSSKVAMEAADSCFKAFEKKSGHKAQPKSVAELEKMEKEADEEYKRFGQGEAEETECEAATGGSADGGGVERDHEPAPDGGGGEP